MVEMRAEPSMTLSNAFSNKPLRSQLVKPAGSQASAPAPPLPVLPPPSSQGRLTVASLWARGSSCSRGRMRFAQSPAHRPPGRPISSWNFTLN